MDSIPVCIKAIIIDYLDENDFRISKSSFIDLINLNVLKYVSTYSLNNILLYSIYHGHNDIFNKLLKDRRLYLHHYNLALYMACTVDNTEMINELLKDIHVTPYFDHLNIAVSYGSPNAVSMLLKDNRINPNEDNNIIALASLSGNVDTIDVLLKDERIDPNLNINLSISCAAMRGHLDIINRLLIEPRINTYIDYRNIINKAYEYGHTNIVKKISKHHNNQKTDRNNKTCFCM